MYFYSIFFGAAIGSTTVLAMWILLHIGMMFLGGDMLGFGEYESNGKPPRGAYPLLLVAVMATVFWIPVAISPQEANGWLVAGVSVLTFWALFKLTDRLIDPDHQL